MQAVASVRSSRLCSSPWTFADCSSPNRIVMAPMTRKFSPSGVPGDDVAAYYRRRAEAETGLIITEGVGIDHPAALGEAGLGEADMPHLYGDEALAGWRRVVEACMPRAARSCRSCGTRASCGEPGTGPHPEAPSVRPSGLWGPVGRQSSISPEYVARISAPTQPMTEKDIADVIAAYARSATRAKEAGFDGIAIHGAHGYLIDTFFWDETNQRKDRWGGRSPAGHGSAPRWCARSARPSVRICRSSSAFRSGSSRTSGRASRRRRRNWSRCWRRSPRRASTCSTAASAISTGRSSRVRR